MKDPGCRTPADLAHKLSLEVVAEGVENRSQLAFLRERGCDQVQGFLFSHPTGFEASRAWLDQWEEQSDRQVLFAVRESLGQKPR